MTAIKFSELSETLGGNFLHNGAHYYAKNLDELKSRKLDADNLGYYPFCLWLDIYDPSAHTCSCAITGLAYKPEVYAYVGGKLMGLYLGNRVSESAITAEEGKAYLLSKSLDGFQRWYNAPARPVKDFELVLTTSVFLGDYDLHGGNVGIQKLDNTIVVSKVDHDSALTSFFYHFHNHDHHQLNLATTLSVLTEWSDHPQLNLVALIKALEQILSVPVEKVQKVTQDALQDLHDTFTKHNVQFEVDVAAYLNQITDRIHEKQGEAKKFKLDLELEHQVSQCNFNFAQEVVGNNWQDHAITSLSKFQALPKSQSFEYSANGFYQALEDSVVTLGQLAEEHHCPLT